MASANAIVIVNSNRPVIIEILLKIVIVISVRHIISNLTSNHSFCKGLIASVTGDIRHFIPCRYQAKCVSKNAMVRLQASAAAPAASKTVAAAAKAPLASAEASASIA